MPEKDDELFVDEEGQFKQYLWDEVKDTHIELTEMKVADLRLGYHNRELIKLLKDRGSKLASGADDVDVITVDNKIAELIRDNGDAISKPVCAFITFTNQEAKERVLKYLVEKTPAGLKNEDFDGFVSLGCNLRVRDAPEPSDIIWENL